MAVAIAPSATRSTDTRLFNGDGCPTEWLLDKVAEANGVQTMPKYFYVFGNVGHGMIDTDIKTGGSLDAVEFYLGDWLESTDLLDYDWIETKNGRKADFIRNLWDVYYKWVGQWDDIYDSWGVVGTELELKATTSLGTEVTSTIDFVTKDDDGRTHVIDWKIGTSKSGKDMQLYVYWWLMRKNEIVADDEWFRGHFHYVNYSNPIGYTSSGKYPGDEFIEDYINASQANRKHGKYIPNPSWFSCNYCNHKEACPLYANDPVQAWIDIQNTRVVFI